MSKATKKQDDCLNFTFNLKKERKCKNEANKTNLKVLVS